MLFFEVAPNVVGLSYLLHFTHYFLEILITQPFLERLFFLYSVLGDVSSNLLACDARVVVKSSY
jgi:hypothetical protein